MGGNFIKILLADAAGASHINWLAIIHWIGNFHPVVLHFPIAMITMAGIAELLNTRHPGSLYANSSRFMILTAAIVTLPNALLGLALGYEVSYPGPLSDVFWWHGACGFTTAGFALFVAWLRERYERSRDPSTLSSYRTWLAFLVLLVLSTAYLGGEMTWGLNHFFKL